MARLIRLARQDWLATSNSGQWHVGKFRARSLDDREGAVVIQEGRYRPSDVADVHYSLASSNKACLSAPK